MMSELDRVTDELKRNEAVIERGLKTFVEVGSALMDIRDARLYRNGYATFEDYCQQRWNMSRPRAYQLIEASETVKGLSTNVDTPTPTTESQARELSGLEPETAAEVMKTAHDSGKVTASSIREARERVAPKPAIAKVTETTKTETYVDTETGEVVGQRDPVPAGMPELPPFIRDLAKDAEPTTGENPFAVAAKAKADFDNRPFNILMRKIMHNIRINLGWIEDHTVDALFEDFDADRIQGDGVTLDLIESDADRMLEVATQIKASVDRRRDNGLRVVR